MTRHRVSRAVAVLSLLTVPAVVTACGGSSSTSSNSTTSVTGAVTTSPPASVLPSTTVTTGANPYASTCTALGRALKVEELQPRTTSNWALEKQRVVTDAASNVALWNAATQGAPADIQTALGKLVAYGTFLGNAVQQSNDVTSATSAIGAYQDKVGASLASAAVDTWKRANCPA